MCEAFLQQAFQQLDQQHLHGVVPLVCRAWHQAALSSSETLEVHIASPAKAKQLQLWMKRRVARLQSISLSFPAEPDVKWYPEVSAIYSSISGKLRELRLRGCRWPLDGRLSALTSLTALSLPDCYICSSKQTALLALTQLRTFDLTATRLEIGDGMFTLFSRNSGFLSSLSTALVQLTQLNVTRAGWLKNEDFRALCALPDLGEVQAGRLDIRPARLRHEFAGLPLTSIGVHVTPIEGEAGEAKAWLQQSGAGTQLSPLSCLRSLQLFWMRSPTSTIGMESWASKLAQLTELVVRPAYVSEDEVRQAFGPRFLSRKPGAFGAFVLRPVGDP